MQIKGKQIDKSISGNGLTFSNGILSSNIGSGLTFSNSSIILENVISAGNIGSSSSISTITYDMKGRIVGVTSSNIFANNISGGVHGYSTTEGMYDIPLDKRQWGMLCVIYDDSIDNGIYTLKYNYVDTDLNNDANWTREIVVLDANGKIDPTQLPSIAITDTFVVNSEAEMLNLTTAEQGDIAVRTDVSKTFILTTNDYSDINDWVELKAPTDLPDIITAGSVGSATHIPVFSYDSKGRVTATSQIALELPDIVTAATMGSSSSIPVISYDSKGRIISVTSSSFFVPELYTEISLGTASSLIASNLVVPNKLYAISGVDSGLYGGTTIYVKGLQLNKFDTKGYGKFFNPKYDQNINGYGIYNQNATYSISDTVIWGGRHFSNNSGDTGTPNNEFSIDSNWDSIPFDDINYNVVYDEITYDWDNNIIMERFDGTNRVISTYDGRVSLENTYGSSLINNGIRSFQWGNKYDISANKGIGNNIIINSSNVNINFTGMCMTNIQMDNVSLQYGLNFDSNSYQNNVRLRSSLQSSLSFYNSYQANVELSNSSQILLTLTSSNQQRVILNNSEQISLQVKTSSQIYTIYNNIGLNRSDLDPNKSINELNDFYLGNVNTVSTTPYLLSIDNNSLINKVTMASFSSFNPVNVTLSDGLTGSNSFGLGGTLSISLVRDYEIITISQSLDLISNSDIKVNKWYAITGVDYNLYGGSTIYVRGIQENRFDDYGYGEFYNPKYDQTVDGFGIWSSSGSYTTGTTSIWGGKLWENENGNVGSSTNIYTLDSEWSEIPYDDINYNKVYDYIRYDWDNNIITMRYDGDNIVETDITHINFLNSDGYKSPIKAFQWGNKYTNYLGGKGIGRNKVIISYNENINFTGAYMLDIEMYNYCKQLGLLFTNGSYQESIYMSDKSYLTYITVNQSYQKGIRLINESYLSNVTINGFSYQKDITLDNGSNINNVLISDFSYHWVIRLNDYSSINTISITQSAISTINLQYSNLTRFNMVNSSIGKSEYTYANVNRGYELLNSVIEENRHYGDYISGNTSSITHILGFATSSGVVKITPDNFSTLVSLPDVITASTIGSSTSIPIITYDSKGRITGTTDSTLDISSTAFVQNGNSFGATAILGANDNQQLYIKSGGQTRMILGTASPFSTVTVIGANNTGGNPALSVYTNNLSKFIRFRPSDGIIDFDGTLSFEPAASTGGVQFGLGLARFVKISDFYMGAINDNTGTSRIVYNLNWTLGIGMGGAGSSSSQIPRSLLQVRGTASFPFTQLVTSPTGSYIFAIDNGATSSATISVGANIVPISSTGSLAGFTYDIGHSTTFPFRNIYVNQVVLGGQGPGIQGFAGFAASQQGRGVGISAGLGSQQGYGLHVTPGDISASGEFGALRLYGNVTPTSITGSIVNGILLNQNLRYDGITGNVRGIYINPIVSTFSNYNYSSIETTIGNVRLITGTYGGSVIIGATQTLGTYSTKVIIRGDFNTQQMSVGYLLQAFTNSITNSPVFSVYNNGVYANKYLGSAGDYNYPGDLDISRARIGNIEIGTGAGTWTGQGISAAGTNRTMTFAGAMGALNSSDTVMVQIAGNGGNSARTTGTFSVLGFSSGFAPPSGDAEFNAIYSRMNISATPSLVRNIYISDNIVTWDNTTLNYRGIQMDVLNYTYSLPFYIRSSTTLTGSWRDIFRLDGTGNIYSNGHVSIFGSMSLSMGNINLATSGATSGNIYQNSSLLFTTKGTDNLFFGKSSGNLTSTGSGGNLAVGANIMTNLTNGNSNLGIGAYALNSLLNGSRNTSVGYASLGTVTQSNANVAVGGYALGSYAGPSGNTRNTAVGYTSMYALVSGIDNTSVGFQAGYYNQTGQRNIYIGYNAGLGVASNSHDNNTLIGYASGQSITTGSNNTAIGYGSGLNLTSGQYNILIGSGINLPSGSISNYISIGDVIFGNGDTGVVSVWATYSPTASNHLVNKGYIDFNKTNIVTASTTVNTSGKTGVAIFTGVVVPSLGTSLLHINNLDINADSAIFVTLKYVGSGTGIPIVASCDWNDDVMYVKVYNSHLTDDTDQNLELFFQIL